MALWSKMQHPVKATEEDDLSKEDYEKKDKITYISSSYSLKVTILHPDGKQLKY